MEATKIMQANVIDIVFENRNKAYGAYSLRKNYQKQLMVALGITFITAIIFSAGILFHHGKKHSEYLPKTPVINVDMMKTLPKEKPVEKKKIVIPKPKKSEAPLKIKMVKLTKPVVAPDKEVKDIPPKQDDKLTIGPVTQNGKISTGLMTAPAEIKGIGGNGKGIQNLSGGDVGTQGFVSVQVEAKFPGGEEAWRKFLSVHLRQNVPLDNGAPVGTYEVTVSFLVSQDGSISDVKAINAPNPDYGTAAEAVRVITRGPNWIPAIQNGRTVPYHQTQKIIFQVQEQ